MPARDTVAGDATARSSTWACQTQLCFRSILCDFGLGSSRVNPNPPDAYKHQFLNHDVRFDFVLFVVNLWNYRLLS